MGSFERISTRRLQWAVYAAALAAATLGLAVPAADAASDVGAAAPAPSDRRPELVYAAPVDRPVVDGFRLDAGTYGPGNRGLEYGTERGDVVRAVAAGRAAFAGPVAGRLVVSVEHPDGRRSTLTHLARVDVRVGDLVARGTPVGLAGRGLHLGVIEDGRYIDPSTLLGRRQWWARLVPLPGTSGRR